jgi:toxin ParE1/3/4
MTNYYVSHRARADLAEAWLYIANDRPAAADRLYERMERQFALLAANPEIGEQCPDLARGLKRMTVGNYVILYRHSSDRMEIVRVIHGARDVSEEFRRHWFT